MSKEKYLITRLSNRKPISLEKIKTKQKEDGVFFNYYETMISQIIEARENKEFEFVCSQIQNFIEENNIDTCFVMNKDELVDCLQEHQKLKIQITDLQSQLAEKEKEIEYQESMKILAVKNQNQKAIAELKKVKEWMNKSDDDGYIFRFASMDTREKFNQKLDQQIKELKGEKYYGKYN